MSMQEVVIPEITFESKRVVDGKFEPATIGLADWVIDVGFGNGEIYKSIDGCNLVVALRPILEPLRGTAGFGKAFRVSAAQLDILKQRCLVPNVGPEAQLALAQFMRALYTAKPVSES